MDWTPGDMSGDVEDRRGSSGGGFGGGGLGLIGFIFLVIISLVTGRNYIGSYLAGGGGAPTSTARGPVVASKEEDRSAHLVSYVLDDVQKTWTTILPEQTGKDYRRATLVLYRGYTSSGCGAARSQTGPFYCPADEKVYIDLSFWDELRRLGGSTADFAQAYVLAHELGHHVQDILGIERKVRQLSSNSPSERNSLSVAMELQADCLAGVWSHTAAQRKLINESDVEEGLKAAAAVGDDHIQRMQQGAVSPETFTHGSSAQRIGWFRRGLDRGEVSACNTFGAKAGSSF
jgi:uncharacterized protein